MTVAALLLFPAAEDALADASGRPAVRRMVETAWAGGATPIIVICHDREGHVASALAGSPAVLAEPAPGENGVLGQLRRGISVASAHVVGTDAVLAWPGRMAWVDAETVTSLIEAHGSDPEPLLRPSHGDKAGHPVLFPLALASTLEEPASGGATDDLLGGLETTGLPARTIELGDPGVVHDISRPLETLPPYEGPPEPVAGPPPEWGAAAADAPEEGPLEGPALAPYPQASNRDVE